TPTVSSSPLIFCSDLDFGYLSILVTDNLFQVSPNANCVKELRFNNLVIQLKKKQEGMQYMQFRLEGAVGQD
ncbi:hypothetical protein HHI36_007870, partial [Cryptolaemus montrouzieri]